MCPYKICKVDNIFARDNPVSHINQDILFQRQSSYFYAFIRIHQTLHHITLHFSFCLFSYTLVRYLISIAVNPLLCFGCIHLDYTDPQINKPRQSQNISRIVLALPKHSRCVHINKLLLWDNGIVPGKLNPCRDLHTFT